METQKNIKQIIPLDSGWRYAYLMKNADGTFDVVAVPVTAQALVECIYPNDEPYNELEFIVVDSANEDRPKLLSDFKHDISWCSNALPLQILEPGQDVSAIDLDHAKETFDEVKQKQNRRLEKADAA